MRRIVICTVLFLVTGACADSPAERVVRADFQQDEFASFYWRFFPKAIAAHPGDTVVFKQEWTGEPHTVTFGTLVDRAFRDVERLDRRYARYEEMPEEDVPREVVERAEREYAEATGSVPIMNPYPGGLSAPSAMLPCYLTRGAPPTEPDESCDREQRKQPAFDGRQSFYSSGFIPPEGPSGNVFRVPLADDIPPGTYRYYCVIHFPDMQGELEVRPPEAKLPSAASVNRRARNEIEAVAQPLRNALREARAGRAEYRGERLPLPIAGYHYEDEYSFQALEFVPRTITAQVGEPVTWTITGAHTISFDVPEYLPIYIVQDDGTVRRNPTVDRAAGGSPKPPPADFRTGPVRIDGGTWDGDGFISSGLLASDPYSTYTLRISKRGRYKYACLIHPNMVGTLIVE